MNPVRMEAAGHPRQPAAPGRRAGPDHGRTAARSGERRGSQPPQPVLRPLAQRPPQVPVACSTMPVCWSAIAARRASCRSRPGPGQQPARADDGRADQRPAARRSSAMRPTPTSSERRFETVLAGDADRRPSRPDCEQALARLTELLQKQGRPDATAGARRPDPGAAQPQRFRHDSLRARSRDAAMSKPVRLPSTRPRHPSPDVPRRPGHGLHRPGPGRHAAPRRLSRADGRRMDAARRQAALPAARPRASSGCS